MTVEQAAAANAAELTKRQRELRTVLSIIGKCVSQGYYNSVIRHSTSLQWIYTTLRCDYDIQQKGIHFFNILDLKYDGQSMTPVSFYNQYRTLISNNLAKNGDNIKYRDNLQLTEDEKMTLMLETIEVNEQNSSIKGGDHYTLNAFKQKPRQQRTGSQQQPNSAKTSLFCVLCFKEKLPREIYTSHNLGDPKCSQISRRDRERLMETFKLSLIKDSEIDFDKDEEDLAEMLGYTNFSGPDNEEVTTASPDFLFQNTFFRTEDMKLSYIRPVSSQVLTVFQEIPAQSSPIHIDLDSGATVNYVTEAEVLKRGFNVYPNGQLSKLGDGQTKLKSIGEIHETFFRNSWSVKFSAIVCKQLTSPFIGGTVFMKQNGVMQDLVRNVIHVHNQQITVQPTDPIALLPTSPIIPENKKVDKHSSKLLSMDKSRILLPGQEIQIPVQMEN